MAQHVKDIRALKLTIPFGVDETKAEKDKRNIYSQLCAVFENLGDIADVVINFKADLVDGDQTQFSKETHKAAEELRSLFQAIATLIRKGESPQDMKKLFEKKSTADRIEEHNKEFKTFLVDLNRSEKLAEKIAKEKGKNKIKLEDWTVKLKAILTKIRNELMPLLKKYADS